jgi:hypothetical protein
MICNDDDENENCVEYVANNMHDRPREVNIFITSRGALALAERLQKYVTFRRSIGFFMSRWNRDAPRQLARDRARDQQNEPISFNHLTRARCSLLSSSGARHHHHHRRR